MTNSMPPVPLDPSKAKRSGQGSGRGTTFTSTNNPDMASTSSSSSRQPSSRSRSARPQQGYTDVIDNLDLTGLSLGGYHHSGPYDVFNSKSKNTKASPIGAFSDAALDPAQAGSSGGTYPGRQSYVPPNSRMGGSGLSARAKMTLAAMEDNRANGNNASTDQLLSTPSNDSRLARRNSENSVTLGFPTNYEPKNEKERQYLETFGISGGEAYEDFGRGASGKWKDPRMSIYPQDAKTFGSNNVNAEGNGNSTGLVPRDLRAARTASIWDMEATLRTGQPVGATSPPLPPMPAMPDAYLTATPPSGSTGNSTGSGSGIKRSKSLMSRMRGKKEKSPSPAPPSPSVEIGRPIFPDINVEDKQYVQDNSADFDPPPVSGASLQPVRRTATRNNSGNRNGQSSTTSPPPAVAPIPLPTPADLSNLNNHNTPARQNKKLPISPDESATANFLASSSSEKSDLLAVSGSDNSLSYYQNTGGSGNLSSSNNGDYSYSSSATHGGATATEYDDSTDAEISKEYAKISLPEASFDGNDASGSGSGNGNRLNRKPSLAKRLLGGRGKK